ncbi:polysaccharide pyruvyl transferase family protein [Marinicrinis lubricantis]|uniref:Polysaccharide pyruvyl transferase family protein n=1 Tax=Marinicrinis lubricantis TaxID=2086470 RepID=A0ABW1IJV6_9BACL
MRNQPNLHPMDELKNRLKGILKVVPPGSEIYLLDYPVYGNGGDMLIWKGTEAFFKEHQIKIRKRYSVKDFPQQHHLAIPEHVIIVLHGGGNFGDLYLPHQQLREYVVQHYPRNRIVILPQTIYYKDERNYDRTAEIFNKHFDLHLYLRDENCYTLAKSKLSSCHLYLMPDMAHQLWPIKSSHHVIKDTLYFLRTDIETNQRQQAGSNTPQGNSCVKDWDTLFNKLERKFIRLFSLVYGRLSGKLPMRWMWSKYTDYLMKKTIREFSSYESIQTSRLHGHILSCLLDKPNTLIDNSYGKNKSYYDAWTYRIESTRVMSVPAPSSEEASHVANKKTLAGV